MAKKKGYYSDEEIVEEALPAVFRVKGDILDARHDCIGVVGEIVRRRLHKQNIEKELALFQSRVSILYQELREKFKNKDTIRTIMDDAIINDKELDFKTVCECFHTLQKKIEDLKITKIETKKIPDEQTW